MRHLYKIALALIDALYDGTMKLLDALEGARAKTWRAWKEATP